MRIARSLVLFALSIGCLAACGGKPVDPTAAPTPAPTATAAPATETPTAAADAAAADDSAAPAAEDSAALATDDTAAPAATDDTAAPAPPPTGDDFGALRKVPLTLQYLVNRRAVACEVTDAGVPDTDLDIKVSCSPDVPWTCLTDTYFGNQSGHSAPGMWRKEGCYAARSDGLWYFAKCPTDKAAFEDPGSVKAVRMLSVNMIANVDKGGEDEGSVPPSKQQYHLVDHGEEVVIDTACGGASDAGMMKSFTRSHCASPRYGYVATQDVWTEMDFEGCRDRSRLLSVQAGIVPPVQCAAESAFEGVWTFTTKVEHAKDKKLVGSEGHYTLSISRAGEGCGLEVAVDKIGIDGKALPADKVQHAKVTLAKPDTTCPYSNLGEVCLQIPVTLADAAGAGVSARYILSRDLQATTTGSATVGGLWQYEGKLAASQVHGVLQGRTRDLAVDPADNEAMKRFDDAGTPIDARCVARVCTFNMKGDSLVSVNFEDSEVFQTCLSPDE